jgi:hypothetical protein
MKKKPTNLPNEKRRNRKSALKLDPPQFPELSSSFSFACEGWWGRCSASASPKI